MTRAPFLLLDDARQGDDGSARLYENPLEIVVARREDEWPPRSIALPRHRAGGPARWL
jgi:hypothetical protein